MLLDGEAQVALLAAAELGRLLLKLLLPLLHRPDVLLKFGCVLGVQKVFKTKSEITERSRYRYQRSVNIYLPRYLRPTGTVRYLQVCNDRYR